VSVDVSAKKSVVSLGFGVYTCASSATVVYTMYTLALWVGEQVVCVRSAYCRDRASRPASAALQTTTTVQPLQPSVSIPAIIKLMQIA